MGSIPISFDLNCLFMKFLNIIFKFFFKNKLFNKLYKFNTYIYTINSYTNYNLICYIKSILKTVNKMDITNLKKILIMNYKESIIFTKLNDKTSIEDSIYSNYCLRFSFFKKL